MIAAMTSRGRRVTPSPSLSVTGVSDVAREPLGAGRSACADEQRGRTRRSIGHLERSRCVQRRAPAHLNRRVFRGRATPVHVGVRDGYQIGHRSVLRDSMRIRSSARPREQVGADGARPWIWMGGLGPAARAEPRMKSRRGREALAAGDFAAQLLAAGESRPTAAPGQDRRVSREVRDAARAWTALRCAVRAAD